MLTVKSIPVTVGVTALTEPVQIWTGYGECGNYKALVAQWLAYKSSKLGVAGSSPAVGI